MNNVVVLISCIRVLWLQPLIQFRNRTIVSLILFDTAATRAITTTQGPDRGVSAQRPGRAAQIPAALRRGAGALQRRAGCAQVRFVVCFCAVVVLVWCVMWLLC